MKYNEFLETKAQMGANYGFEPTFLPEQLKDFQKGLVKWACLKGRSAIMADCGLGKTFMQLVWGQNVVEHTNKPVLILTPLAVAAQTVREGEKFGIDCEQSRDGAFQKKIVVANYHILEKFNADDFGGVVCDESSILKNHDGAFKQQITIFMRRIPYRMLATATPAPNDFIELGTASEALGYMGFMDILGKYFKNDNNNVGLRRHFGEAPKFWFKGHSEVPFWRYIASWARACRMPSDLGFSDKDYILPSLIENKHRIEDLTPPDGMLFTIPARNLPEQRQEKQRTINERCEKVASLIQEGRQSLVWCHFNSESKLLKEMIPNSVEVSGNDSDDVKERRFLDFIDGEAPVLITKPKIGGLGLNFQHCHHMTYFPSHSFEQYYQSVRRCWRFGQKHDVIVDIVYTEGEQKIISNMERKSKQSSEMFQRLIDEMQNATGQTRVNKFVNKEDLPKWL